MLKVMSPCLNFVSCDKNAINECDCCFAFETGDKAYKEMCIVGHGASVISNESVDLRV